MERTTKAIAPLDEENEKHTLVVAIRGWTDTGNWLLFGRPGGELTDAFASTLAAELPYAEIWRPEISMGMFSMRSPESLSAELFAMISAKLARSPQIESVILVAFSAGSLLARRIFCMAHGADINGQLTLRRAPWAEMLERVVVLSGITRGWEFSTASPDHVRFLAPILSRLCLIGGWLKNLRALIRREGSQEISSVPFIYQLKRGAPFVIATRIQYVNVLHHLNAQQSSGAKRKGGLGLLKNGLPTTVFLLGAKDEFVSPADCTELGPRSEFVFVELPGSNHIDAIKISEETPLSQIRRQRLVAAIGDSFEDLESRDWVIPAGDIDDYLDPMDIAESISPDATTVKHVVMVIHGIRDSGFWTKRIAHEIKRLGRLNGLPVRTPTPTYGYFSMWDFVKPGGRDRAAHWFLERYADVRSHFPDAAVSFVGHSNGTYIAARALQICPAVAFENVVFAGSVVRRDFDWQGLDGRVTNVLNYVGCSDGVVAFLPAVFESFRLSWLDVGGAGAFGFSGSKEGSRVLTAPVSLHEVRFVKGGHSAAVDEHFWPEIARFALYGEPPKDDVEKRGWFIRSLFKFSPVITVLCGVAAASIFVLPIAVPVLLSRCGPIAQWMLNEANWGLCDRIASWSVTNVMIVVLGSIFLSWVATRFIKRW